MEMKQVTSLLIKIRIKNKTIFNSFLRLFCNASLVNETRHKTKGGQGDGNKGSHKLYFL